MKISNRLTSLVAILCLFMLAGCVSLRAQWIDTSVNSLELENQSYKPAIVVISGVHRQKSYSDTNSTTPHLLEFLPSFYITQIVGGKEIQRYRFRVRTNDEAKVLALPPGEYRLSKMTTDPGRRYFRRLHKIPRPKDRAKQYSFTVKAGEVVNLGYIVSWYSRKDKSFLDLKIETRQELAEKALREKFNVPGPYIAKLKTRLLNIPSKAW